VRELLKPLLAAWLDENLPRIVEAKVEEEVERIARR
jgi:cell pole-organizing protein PopZ